MLRIVFVNREICRGSQARDVSLKFYRDRLQGFLITFLIMEYFAVCFLLGVGVAGLLYDRIHSEESTEFSV